MFLPNILENKAGIYIYQLISEKTVVFFGSAYNIPKRLEQHRYCINNNINCCPKFYSFVKKHGWLNFRLGVLEYIDINVSTKKLLKDKEQYYLDKVDLTISLNKLPANLLRRKQMEEMNKVIKLLHKYKNIGLLKKDVDYIFSKKYLKK
jgi:hypothetical protein